MSTYWCDKCHRGFDTPERRRGEWEQLPSGEQMGGSRHLPDWTLSVGEAIRLAANDPPSPSRPNPRAQCFSWRLTVEFCHPGSWRTVPVVCAQELGHSGTHAAYQYAGRWWVWDGTPLSELNRVNYDPRHEVNR